MISEPTRAVPRRGEVDTHLPDSTPTIPTSLLFVSAVVAGSVPALRLLEAPLGRPITVSLLAVLIVAFLAGHRRTSGLQRILDVAAALLVAGALLSTPHYLAFALYFSLTLFILVCIGGRVIAACAQDPRWLRSVVSAFLTVQTFSAVVALLQFAGGSFLGMSANDGRANGIAGHPNVLGLMAGIAIVIGVHLTATRTSNRAPLLVVIAINIPALVASGSLSGLMSAALGVAVSCIAARTAARLLVGTIVLSVVLMIVTTFVGTDSPLLGNVSQRIDVVTGQSDGVASLEIRQLTYDYAMMSIKENPVYGVGVDPRHDGSYNGVTAVHNFLLRAYFQGGLLLFLSFCLVTVAAVVGAVRAVRRGDRSLAPAAGVVTIVVVYALTSAFWSQNQYWLPLLLALGILGAPTLPPPTARDSAALPMQRHVTGVSSHHRFGPTSPARPSRRDRPEHY